MKSNREEGEVEEGICNLEGFLEEVRLEKKSEEDMGSRRVLGDILGIIMSQKITNKLLLIFVDLLRFFPSH